MHAFSPTALSGKNSDTIAVTAAENNLFRAKDSVSRCYEGTLCQNWPLDEAGTMVLKQRRRVTFA